MTKQELFALYEQVKDSAVCITLMIHMPTGETEIITNPNVKQKIEYISKTYNDQLIHSNCKEIFIEKVEFCTNVEAFDFCVALGFLKDGMKIARKGWNGKDMFLYYVPAASYAPCTVIAKEAFGGENVPYGAYIAMKTAQGNVVPWVASQADMLSDDWYVL